MIFVGDGSECLMRVCLLFFELSQWNFWGDNLGPEYLAAVLRNSGHEVSIMGIPEKAPEELLHKIQEYVPGMIGFSLPCPFEKRLSFLGIELKKCIPGVHITCGNRYASDNSVMLLDKYPWLDSVIRGEGEHTIDEMCRRLESSHTLEGCKGVYFRNGNAIVMNDDRELIKDLDSMPFPSRDILLDLPKERNATFMSGRGCVNHCTFCNSSYTDSKNGKVWRGRSVEAVVDELEYISETLGYKNFFFGDPSYEEPGSLGKKRIKEIAEEILRRGMKINYGIYFSAHRWNREDLPLLKLLRDSGVEYAYVGVESGDSESLRLFNKKATVEDNYRMIELLRSADIGVKFGFILFHPYLTLEQLVENIDFVYNARIGYSFRCFLNALEVYKGTKMYDRLVQDGLLTGQYDTEIGNYYWKYKDERIALINGLTSELIESDACIKRGVEDEFKVISFVHRVLNHARARGHMQQEASEFKKMMESLYDELNSANHTFMLRLTELVREGYNENTYEEYKVDLVKNTDRIVKQIEDRMFKFSFKAKKAELL